jgi:transcriptional regulator with GAF, ATPase, and Fis domain
MGVHSSLSLPLLVGEELIGALNVYAYAKNAFDDSAVRLGELFATPAAVNVQTAHVLANTKRTMDQLSAALTSRSTIDQALGLIMGRTGACAEEAFERLRSMSQQRNIKLAVLAQSLIDEAIGRARARSRAASAAERDN